MKPPRWIERTPKEQKNVQKHMAECLNFLRSFPLTYFDSDVDQVPIAYRIITLSNEIPIKTSNRVKLVLLTGYNETIDKYCEFIRELLLRSSEHLSEHLTIYIMDHRGQGVSGREVSVRDECPLLAHYSSWRYLVKDVAQFVEQVVHPLNKELLPSSEVVHLFAHSMGGCIGAHVAAANPTMFASVSLNSPLFRLTLQNPVLEMIDLLGPLAQIMSCLGYGRSSRNFKDPQNPELEKQQVISDMRLCHCYERAKWFRKLRVDSFAMSLSSSEDQGEVPHYGICMTQSFGWFKQIIEAYHELPNVVENIGCRVIIFQAEDDVLVSSRQINKIGELIPQCTVLKVGHGSFHEAHFGGEDKVKDLILSTILQNICGVKKIMKFPKSYLICDDDDEKMLSHSKFKWCIILSFVVAAAAAVSIPLLMYA